MEYKSHPYYGDSDARDWVSLRPDDWTELEPGPEKTLQEMLRAHKPWLCDLALARIRPMCDKSDLAERPFPEVRDFLFFPIGETGYQVYVEYFFNQRPECASPDSDFWWAIINCPNAVPPYPTGRREASVIGLGWVVP